MDLLQVILAYRVLIQKRQYLFFIARSFLNSFETYLRVHLQVDYQLLLDPLAEHFLHQPVVKLLIESIFQIVDQPVLVPVHGENLLVRLDAPLAQNGVGLFRVDGQLLLPVLQSAVERVDLHRVGPPGRVSVELAQQIELRVPVDRLPFIDWLRDESELQITPHTYIGVLFLHEPQQRAFP